MRRAGLGALLAILLASGVEAAVTRVEVARREPFAGGHAFAGAGAYEKVVGRFHGELDPAHPMNRGIVDLDLAPRNARGRVEYTADFYILRPADLARGNGSLLYDVNNRGRKLRADPAQQRARRPTIPTRSSTPATAFSCATDSPWCGAAGFPEGKARARACACRCRRPGAPAGRSSRRCGTTSSSTPRASPRRRSPSPSRDRSSATLFVRERGERAPTALPAGQWELVNERTDPAAAGGDRLPHRHALPARLQGGQPAGVGHRLCGHARPRGVPQARARRRRRDREPAGDGRPGPPSAGRWPTAHRRVGATCAISSIRASTRTRAGASSSRASTRTSPPRGCSSISASPSPSAAPAASIPDQSFPFAYETAGRSAERPARRHPGALPGARELSQDPPHGQLERVLAVRPLAGDDRSARSLRRHAAGQRADLSRDGHPAPRRPRRRHAEGRVRAAAEHGGHPSGAARHDAGARRVGEGRHGAAAEPLPACRRRHAGAHGAPGVSPRTRARAAGRPDAQGAPGLRAGVVTRRDQSCPAGARWRRPTRCWSRASTPTATRSPACGCRRVAAPTATLTGLGAPRARGRRRRHASAGWMAAACRSRAPGPSARPRATPGSRWKSATAIRPATSPRFARPPRPSSASAICWPRTSRASSTRR